MPNYIPTRHLECHTCNHIDAESHVSRNLFALTVLEGFHADVHAAWSILYKEAGICVLGVRYRGSDTPKSHAPYTVLVVGEPEKSMGHAHGVCLLYVILHSA